MHQGTDNISILDFRDEEIDEMPENEFSKKLIIRLLKHHEKQIYGLRNAYCKTEILKRKQNAIFVMKNSISQIKNIMESITKTLGVAEKTISMLDQYLETLHQTRKGRDKRWEGRE